MNEDFRGQIRDPKAAAAYILSGKATVSFYSRESGKQFTYRVRLAEKRGPDDGPAWFVDLLNGPDNERCFAYIGYIRGGRYAWGRPRDAAKAWLREDAPSVKAFKWAFDRILRGTIPDKLEIWHERWCGRCGKKLTVRASIASGYGPECAERVGMVLEPPPVRAAGAPAEQPKKEFAQAELPFGSVRPTDPDIDAKVRQMVLEQKYGRPDEYFQGGLSNADAFKRAYRRFEEEIMGVKP